MPKFTEEEYHAFKDLVLGLESYDQNRRIEARLEMPRFIEKHGKKKCDAMFERVNEEHPLD